MENANDGSGFHNYSIDSSTSAVNKLILDYYKKFGKKRDLEQFFSLSTAQSEIRDPTGTFWRRMKSENDSSDFEKKSEESSAELCRISIRCSVPEPTSSQKRHFEEHQNSNSESPPIITEEVGPKACTDFDNESVKSDDAQSQRSHDATLDLSMNKPHSPTSSITSQRKLEWDSLADVGYANESDRKNSASSLSTLERLALKQQYSHNDSKHNIDLGMPTSQSTPVEETEKSKGKRGLIKKSTKIYQKDVDFVELHLPHSSQTNLPQAISVNLSKQICFNVEKDGEINIDNIKKNVSVSPEKNCDLDSQIQERLDKEIQTSLIRHTDKSTNLTNPSITAPVNNHRYPVLISLNTLKNKNRKRKLRLTRKKLKNNNKIKVDSENGSPGKVVEQGSEAESFEYMPGHMYNQNHLKVNQSRETHAGNKSSLESSAGLTTDSSKESKRSFSKDFQKSIDILKSVLQQHDGDSTLKKKLIKEVVSRLIKTKYRDDGSSSDFLSGLSINSKIIGATNHTTTSTSDTNNTSEKVKSNRPKKSILRTDKFNSNAIASTSQSAPNLPSVSNSEKPVTSNLTKSAYFSNTDSDFSSKEKFFSDVGIPRTSSEALYKKYIEAVRREQAYKQHLKDKENFLKQKLVSSDTAITQLAQADLKTQNKLKSLLKDLTRNNYNDGSGDASKLEGYSNCNEEPYTFLNRPRSHSVFTLSSGNSEVKNKNPKLKNIIKSAIQSSSKSGGTKNEHHYCCCPYHTDYAKVGFADSSVQVNIKCDKPAETMQLQNGSQKKSKCTNCGKESPRNIARVVSDADTGDLKYLCVCSNAGKASDNIAENFLIYKCSRLINKSVQLGDTLTRSSNIGNEECTKEVNTNACKCGQINANPQLDQVTNSNSLVVKGHVCSRNIPLMQNSKSSQTNLNLNFMSQPKCSARSISSQSSGSSKDVNIASSENDNPKLFVSEAIRSIQTEISINPKLSDPGLSDINIIDDIECVKLVREQYKGVSKQSSEKDTEEHVSEKKSQLSSGNSLIKVTSKTDKLIEQPRTVKDAYNSQSDKEIQFDINPLAVDNDKKYIDHFTIPIQGTNMTLQVNLGTQNSDKVESNNNAIISQGVVTEKPNVLEQFTSLREDCTKSIQCCEANIFKQMKENRYPTNNESEQTILQLNNREVRTCLIEKPQYNTYPREDQVSTRKHLLRTNTDTSNFKHLESLRFEFKNPYNQSEFSNNLAGQPTKSNIQNHSPGNQFSTCSNDKGLSDPILTFNKENTEKFTSDNIFTDQPTTSHDQYESSKCTACSNQIFSNKSTNNQNQSEKFTTFSNKKYLTDQPVKPSNPKQSDNFRTYFNQKDLSPQPTERNISAVNGNENEKPPSPSNQKYLTAQPLKLNNPEQSENCRTCINQKDLPLQKTEIDKPNNNENQCENHTNFSGQKYLSKQTPNDQTTSENFTTAFNQKDSSPEITERNNHNQSAKCITCSNRRTVTDQPTKSSNRNQSEMYLTCSSKCSKTENIPNKEDLQPRKQSKTSASDSEAHLEFDTANDPVLDIIQDITRRYSKKDIERSKRKKCFKEIMTFLNYLLDTDDQKKTSSNIRNTESSLKQDDLAEKETAKNEGFPEKTFVDKGVQLSTTKSKSNKSRNTSSDAPVTSDFQTTSTDSATCKVINKIKKECEKYHQKRCKSHNGLKTCETSSTTSINCDQCKRIHHCHCTRYKCRTYKTKAPVEKPKKKCVAYNLILQTSDSIVSEEAIPRNNCPLKSIIVKVPSKRRTENVPFKETSSKFERNLPNSSPRSARKDHRSRSLPNESEISSEEFLKKPHMYTVREYLERNRPDFVERCSRRQDCLKVINETRANERHAKRKLLSMQLGRQQTLSSLTDEELHNFAKQLSEELRRKNVAPKFISEREMKRHSEKIYKSLPEVTRKKEELKKENMKKTNLLMANIFKKNLQKKTLRGSVNLSNYSTVIKI